MTTILQAWRIGKGALLAGLVGTVTLVLLSGCMTKSEETAALAALQATPRPAVFAQATAEIKAGRPAVAQEMLKGFIARGTGNPYYPEALYLYGQALVSQGLYLEARPILEQAVELSVDRNVTALAMLSRADCNMALGKYSLASRQYHWLETMYRDVRSLPQDEILYKLGLAAKKAGNQDFADYWFKQVIELYAQSPYAEKAKLEHSLYTPKDPDVAPLVYSLEVDTFNTFEEAEAAATILANKGYRDVQVVSTTRSNIPTFEVHVGKFENRNSAVRAQTDAELAGLPTRIRPALIEPMK
jgi:TolA-binding protein